MLQGTQVTGYSAWARATHTVGSSFRCRIRSEFARHVQRPHGDIVVRVGAISALRLARQDSQAVEFCGVPIVNAKVPMRHDVAPLKSAAQIESIGWCGLGVTRSPAKQLHGEGAGEPIAIVEDTSAYQGETLNVVSFNSHTDILVLRDRPTRSHSNVGSIGCA